LLSIDKILDKSTDNLLGGVPEGYDGVVLSQLIDADQTVLFVARDDRRMAALKASLAFFASDVEVIEFPAWDCLPYDRVSPKSDIIAARIDALTNLVDRQQDQPRIILTTIAALLQRVPARKSLEGSSLTFGEGGETLRDRLLGYLEQNGYGRSETVMEPGEYAIRGGIIDLFPPGFDEPLRLDFFGDDLDGIRTFEPFSQRTSGERESFTLKPVNEISLDEDAISRFRTAYRALFGAVSSEDPLYEAVSEGHAQAGMEHWLPLFHEELETLLDYLPSEAVIALDHQAEEAAESRWELVNECYDARADMKARGLAVSETTYNPLPVDRLYLTSKDLDAAFANYSKLKIQPFSAPEQAHSSDVGGKPGRDFADARALPDVNVYDALRDHIQAENKAGRAVVIGAFSEGSAERLLGILKEHNIAASTSPEASIRLAVLELEHGFTSPGLALITEQDILGDRLSSPQRRKIRPENFIAETSVLSAGDLVVHSDHGIGRFEELVTLDVTDSGAPHDCLQLTYHGGDKLFLPVENIEIISRYGEGSDTMRLDKLGGVAWQARKSQLKQRIRDMADQLIVVAAARELKKGEAMEPQPGVYDEFCSGFAFTETEDQARAIGDVIKDMASGRPMDRLICGDVGFGKTEVALRAAFVAAMEGKQVAIVVPTTLLSRQHVRIFQERFADFPVKVRQLSRLVGKKEADETKEGLKSGQVDIVIGTHALLAENTKFDRLGLLIIDEEQHFGVAHKEQLKSMKHNVHVLTLTATPIPRTLQMALTGVRELSLITTPPVDRLAVRTFVLPYDPVVVREAIQRERYRGGQIFYVCPRVADLGHVEEELKELVPDLRIAMAHGKMSPAKLEDVMNAFYDGKYDLLLATNIVESGLDLPSVNTIILHRSDMFGLAQLYQLRGRIGRSKIRGYAYLTLPPKRKLAASALKRLEVMQSLDTLGAGFTLASHDLDIRGAGNLLGDEQSGHIKEVGVELYQQMLEEAVAEAKSAGDIEDQVADKWSPQIDIGVPVLIPSDYVPDLGIRLSLYRRIADLTDRAEIDGFAAEMIDRFGSLPEEVENLLETVAIKRLCLAAGVDKVDAGSKGAVISFRNNEFNNPAGLVEFITSQVGTSKLRPDHKLVFMRSWGEASERLSGVQYLMKELSDIAA
jgi:transcription-repair coupling factor (superfamily II helicase)